MGSKKRYHDIKMENLNCPQDKYFINELLVPYLSSVYYAMINQQKKVYLTIGKMKNYLNLPELIGQRIVEQINANGDERIDHDEFVRFFLKLLMGTHQQKMLIAFKCYNNDGDQVISNEEIKIILNNVPLSDVKKQPDTNIEYMKQKILDRE